MGSPQTGCLAIYDLLWGRIRHANCLGRNRDREGRGMASYKIMPLTYGQFRVEVDEGQDQDNPIVTGPFNTEAAARAYIEGHSRMARADNRWARATAPKIA
jgi:hypothetical protein